MLRSSLFKKVVFLGALASVSFAHAGYAYRIPIHVVVLESEAPKPVGPSLVGDGSSTQGACATGISGCATWNSNDSANNLKVSDNGLAVSRLSGTTYGSIRATTGKSAGKWYWEVTPSGSFQYVMVGVTDQATVLQDLFIGATGAGYAWNVSGYGSNTGQQKSGVTSTTQYQSVINGGLPNDTYMVAYNADTKQLWLGKNCAWAGGANPGTGVGPLAWGFSNTTYPATSIPGETSGTVTANFGQANFKCAVPAGYNAGLW